MLLQVGGAELDPGLVEGIANLAAELVVVGEDAVAERLLQLGGRVDQAPVTLPGLGVEELLLLLLGQPLLRGLFLALVFIAPIVRAPLGEPLLERGFHLGEVVEERVAQLVVERAADVLVARGEAQRLDGLRRELAVQAQRALDRHLPVAEGGIGEDLGLLGLLEGVVRRMTCSMSSSESSQFFLPRFLRSGLNHCVASMSCTLPLRGAAFRLESTQT
jgi:hypothetical protein